LSGVFAVSREVRDAVAAGRPVVALETTLVSHGFPRGEGAAVGIASERAVRDAGAVPATVGVLDGAVRVGLTETELARIADAGPDARKAGPRDLAVCAAQNAIGATTVGGTLAACRAAGIRFMGTGGLGGVHRGLADRLDISPDLSELARTPVLVVSSGVKSLLDVAATAEALETLGVPVLGWRTDTLPLFYAAEGGPPLPARVETLEEAVRVAAAHWELGGAGVVVARPPDASLDDVEPLIEEALRDAAQLGVEGQRVTPFVLAFVHERSGGRTLSANRDLIVSNVALAAEIAVAHAA
jgi:pseudouridylate synthase